MGVEGEGGGGGVGREVRTEWTDQGSVRELLSAGGAVEEEESWVVLGLDGGSRVLLASVRGNGADMVGLWNWNVL